MHATSRIATILAVIGAVIPVAAAAREWNVSLWGKPRAFTQHVEKLAELVKEKTGGKFTLKISYGGLSGNKENLDGLAIGAFEMAQFCAGYHAAKTPTLTVLELPFLGVASLEQEIAVSRAIYNHPAIKKDLSYWNATLLMPSPLPQYNIAGFGPPPRTLKDFRGLNLRATGGIGRAMASVGAVPTSMSASEVRQALDSSVIKGAAFAPHAHLAFGTLAKSTWWTANLNPGTVHCPVAVNSRALSELTDAERAALLGSVDEALAHYVTFYKTKTMVRWWPALDANNVERVTFPDDVLARFREDVAGPAAADWIREKSAYGIPALSLYELVKKTISETAATP